MRVYKDIKDNYMLCIFLFQAWKVSGEKRGLELKTHESGWQIIHTLLENISS